MAQTGYTPISIYYSATASNTPSAGNLVAGELAINTADGKLFYKDSSGVVQTLATKGGVGSSTTTQVLYNSSGLVVGSANMTFNGTSLTLANDASISGLTVGKGGGSVSNNTVVGSGALAASSGTECAAFGIQTLQLNTGNYNAGFGAYSLYNNTSGVQNVGIGRRTLFSNTTGVVNTAVGDAALNSNTTGQTNTAVGGNALQNNTTASSSTAVGYQSMYTNTTGGGQAFGYQALYSQTTGTNNSAFGYQALYLNTTGYQNIAMGDNALNSNTSGINNVGLGVGSLRSNTTASNNTAVGYQAGYSNQAGGSNVFIGNTSGYSTTASNGFNTFVGASSGYFVTTGYYNTILGGFSGNQSGLDIRTASNYIVLSDGAGNPRVAINGSGYMMVGDPAYTDARITVSENLTTNNGITVKNTVAQTGSQWFMAFRNSANAIAGTIAHTGTTTVAYNTSSDVRLKENIVDAPTALPIVENINVRSYDWKEDKRHVDFGFIAQELHSYFPEAVFVGDSEEQLVNEKGTWQVEYGRLTPILVKAIQELNAKVTALEAQLGAK